jgi:hypothetical protein
VVGKMRLAFCPPVDLVAGQIGVIRQAHCCECPNSDASCALFFSFPVSSLFSLGLFFFFFCFLILLSLDEAPPLDDAF